MSFTSATYRNARNKCVGNAGVFVVMLVSSWQLSILSELSHSNEKTGLLIGSQTGTDHFQLKLAPPPLFEE